MKARLVLALALSVAGCNREPFQTLDADTVSGHLAASAKRAVPEPKLSERFEEQRAALPPIAPGESSEEEASEESTDPGTSLRVAAAAIVYTERSFDSVELGIIAGGTRLPARPLTENDECPDGWLHVEPRGFICAGLEPNERAPEEHTLPVVPGGAVVPGVYGKIRSADATFYSSTADVSAGRGRTIEGSLTVRRLGRTTVDGQSYWKTRHGLVAASDVHRYRGSRFRGVEIEDGLEKPLAWTIGNGERFSVAVRRAPTSRSRTVRRVKLRKIFPVIAESEDGRYVSIGEDEWILRREVRVAERVERPDGVGERERWIDVDLEQQTLVAYLGAEPVYATLVSSGKVLHRTPTGTYRIDRKVALRTMNSMADSKETYSVDKVPWTAYFARGYAFHAAFWHQGFGRTRSHGCVNLAPRDARYLYAWMAPAVAPGWREVFGNETQPGSLVRIRDRKNPEPPLRGYAANLARPENDEGESDEPA